MSVGPIAPPTAGPSVSGVGAPVQGASSGGGQAPSLPLPAATAQVASAPTSPLAALTATISEALATQDSLAPLLADLGAALQSPALPPAARATVEQILALQAPLAADVTGAALKAAVGQSGLFLEAGLAAGVLKSASAPEASAANRDLKSLLLRLPADLSIESLVAAEAAAPAALGLSQAARRAGPRPPPPIGGGRTTGQAAAPAVVDAETDGATLHHILSQEAHAALARLELMQLASLPKAGEPSRWAFELPVATPQGAGMAQFEISRDGTGGGAVSSDGEPSWKARFSIHLDAAGPVHAEVALSHGRTRVTLWAERDSLRHDLEQDQAGLASALAGEEGGDAAVRVLSGAPAGPVAAASGQLVNRTS